MLHVDLSQLAGGTLQEKFDREITRVIDNMQDPNTPFGEKRKITINISFVQNEMRDDAKIESCALFEADGGTWKFDAVHSIAEYLKNELEGVENVAVLS